MDPSRPPSPAEVGARLGALSREQRGEIQALFQRCGEFLKLTTGHPAGPDEAERLFADVPPGRSEADKHVWGIRDAEGALVGVVDVLRGYPRDDVWFLGLLLLDPDRRGQGLGAWALAEVTARAAAAGVAEVHLAVVPRNVGGLRFWRREGFREVRLSRQLGTEDAVDVIVMTRRLPGAEVLGS